MSNIESEARLEAEKPKRPRSYARKQYTRQEVLEELRSFASDFRDFNVNPTIISTPQADLGIGPVKYNVELPAQRETSRKKLDKLNEIIKFEKRDGDRLIRFDAALLSLATGREDPYLALPALLRMVARAEIQEATVRSLRDSQVAGMKQEVPTLLVPLILYFDRRRKIANGSEVSFLADLELDLGGDLGFMGLIKILAKRRKNKYHATMAHAYMRSVFQKAFKSRMMEPASGTALAKSKLLSDKLSSVDTSTSKTLEKHAPGEQDVQRVKDMEQPKATQSSVLASPCLPSGQDTMEEKSVNEDTHAAEEPNQTEPTHQDKEVVESNASADGRLRADGIFSNSTNEVAGSDSNSESACSTI